MPSQLHPPPLTLLPAFAIGVLALVAALVFGSLKHDTAERVDCLPEGLAKQISEDHGQTTHDQHADRMYYAGGLWSPELGLGGLAELAVQAAVPSQDLTIHSVSWDPNNEWLVAIDVSPINTAGRKGQADAPPVTVVSVDHRGGDIAPAFAVGIQQHVQALPADHRIILFTPLPGDDARPDDEDPYDWTFLDDGTGRVQVVDWIGVEPKPLDPNRPMSGYLNAWLIEQRPDLSGNEVSIPKVLLLDTLVLTESARIAEQLWQIVQYGPYRIVPLLEYVDPDLDSDNVLSFRPELPDELLLMRAMRVAADKPIDEAATSDDPVLRALAARAIGELADLTTDPLGKVTPLAEDRDMRVRYEVLVATRAMPGRRAAGVAQLVEPYEMDDAMRRVYADTMAGMAKFGEPVAADSRADRLRRMPIDELLEQERDAIVCTILLGRRDLPDDQFRPVLEGLAQASEKKPLAALIDLLAGMNPRTLAGRAVLRRALIDWDVRSLQVQSERLAALAIGDGSLLLRTTAAAAFLRSAPPEAVIERVGVRPVLFAGLARVDDPGITNAWAPKVVAIASGEQRTDLATRVAAFDALAVVPDDVIRPEIPSILDTARSSENIDLRFAAIRAINALPPSIQPGDIDDLRLTTLTIASVPGQMKYDLETLTAVAGRPVELTLVNPDTMEHNLVITKPGQMQAIGLQITAMNPAEAAAVGYVPNSDAVLYHTAMVPAGGSDTLRFVAPMTPGEYPYVCTFPGHYTSMYGTLEVVAP